MTNRDHDLSELKEGCDGTYDGDQMMVWECGCKDMKYKTTTMAFINGKAVKPKIKYVNAGNLYLDPIRKRITVINIDKEIGWELHDIVRKEGSYKNMDYEQREKEIRKLFAKWFREILKELNP